MSVFGPLITSSGLEQKDTWSWMVPFVNQHFSLVSQCGGRNVWCRPNVLLRLNLKLLPQTLQHSLAGERRPPTVGFGSSPQERVCVGGFLFDGWFVGGSEGGAADHLARGEREGRWRGHFLPTAWKCFVNVTVRCRCFCCCPQAAWLVGESSVAGQKNLDCRHTCFNTGGKARGEETLLSAHLLHTVNHNSPNVPITARSDGQFFFAQI